MAQIQIYRAASDRDFEDAQALCREWVEWQLKTYPEQREKIARKFLSGDYDRTVADLAEIHAAPEGAVVLCKLDGKTVGCVMYDRMDQQVAEVHRLFVTEDGRGHGIGRALLEEMFGLMRAAGYTKVRFSSARFLKHARDLYGRMGFFEVPAPKDMPPHVYFMEREL
ncbi:GNAT family N-acetyltransferase [Limimaricola soesokkakensis]|uniref:GNAT family N-acetyltransferase n=1 Tax=Limimaricola soesokkakensis TaxID=1343159 RepID=UPI003513EB64